MIDELWMQGNMRSQKPKLTLGLKINVTKRTTSYIEEVEGVENSIENSLTVEPLIEVSPIPTRLEKENFPSRLSEEEVEESNI